MIRDYRDLYLNDYVNLLASAFDYAMVDLNIDIDEFESIFLSSKYIRFIEILDPGVISGQSGVELVLNMLDDINYNYKYIEQRPKNGRTPEYWVGYALANYQFQTKKRFKDIFNKIHLVDIIRMYKVYHEMDITNFIDDFDKMLKNINTESKLKKFRENRGLSQSELARLANVNLRSIQLYEQKVNDIDKAQANTLYKISTVLGCSIDDLLENPEE